MHIDTKIKCVKSEIQRRKKTFPKLVEIGRISQDRADREIETMNHVLQTLTQLKGMIEG